MADERPKTKAQLMSELDRTWPVLNDVLDNLTDEQMTNIRDPEGWAIKDHINHMAAWEQSVVAMLQGRPRYEGLGVDKKLYEEGNDDDINAVIQRGTKDLTAAISRAQLEEAHEQFLKLLEPMTDEDLLKPYSHYLPDE